MKTLVVNRNIIVSIFVVMLLIYGLQGISYGQYEVEGEAPIVTPGETNTSLVVSFRDYFYAYDVNAYQIQFRRKTPQGDWITVCSVVSSGSRSGGNLSDLPIIGIFFFPGSRAGVGNVNFVFTNLEPGTTYEARYRDTNLSECTENPPSPDPWTAIAEGTTHLVTPPRVEFVDANLARAIRRALNLDTGGEHIELLKIPEAALAKLIELVASKKDIINLTSLEHATQLTTLHLPENNLRDLTPLAQLTQLTELDLSENNISDLTPLTQLTQLTGLFLRGNSVSDLTPLTQLTQLTGLFLRGNSVSDLTPLAQLMQLTGLDLSENNISDLTPLTQLTQLTGLSLRGNSVSDLTPLAQLMQLTVLNLRDNNISDLTPLTQLTQLRELVLSFNLISDLTPLAQLTQLTELHLEKNNISDLTSLAQLTQRTRIYHSSRDWITSGDIELITVSTPQPLIGTTLNGSLVTLTLLPSGAAYDTSINNIRDAVTVSGIHGVTVSDVTRVSDTEVTVALEFTGDLDGSAWLTFTVAAVAVAGYDGRTLTGNTILVSGIVEVVASTAYPLTAVTLNGAIVTLTLSSGAFRYLHEVRNALTISDIPGIGIARWSEMVPVSNTEIKIKLTFNGDNITTDSILTLTVGSDAIALYNGPAYTLQIPVTAVSEAELAELSKALVASTAYPLTAVTLNGSIVTLKLTSGVYRRSDGAISWPVKISGIQGVTFFNDVRRVSATELTFELDFSGTINADATLTFTVGPGMIAGYNGPARTAEIPVSASTEVEVTGELVASTAFPLTKETLNGSVVKLTLKNNSYDSYDSYLGRSYNYAKPVVGVFGIPGVKTARLPSGHSIYILNSTKIWVRLHFTGNLDTNATLTFTVPSRLIKDYNGPPLAATLPVTVKTGKQVLVPETSRPSMYWINTDTGKIKSLEPFEAVTNQVTSLTVDTAGGKVYWSEHDSSSGTIKRANLDGTSTEVLVTQTTPGSISVDTTGKKLYWVNSLDGKIQSANLNGENISTVSQLEEDIVHIAVDTEGGKLYWVDSQYRIRRMNLDGTSIETPLSGWESDLFRGIGGLAIADGKIYWTERQIWYRVGGIIHRANLNGTDLETLATSFGEPTGIAVDTAANKVYWANSFGGIQRTDINGGEIENVVYGITAPGDFALGTASTHPTLEPPVATTNVTVSILPASVAAPAIGQQIEFSLNITSGEAVAGYQATVQFDTTALRYVSGANGDYLPDAAFFVQPVVEGNLVKLNVASLAGESSGDGTLATLTFEVVSVKASTLMLSELLLTDSAGNASVPKIENAEITEPKGFKEDVNGDGTVNIQDLVLVNSNLGKTGQNAADVNGDGLVNIADLVLVAGALDTSAAAPSLYPQPLSMLTAAEVKLWLSQAQQLDLTDPTSLRGIRFLEQLLAMLIPKETVLLPNYPNPFNPETWIPYRLAQDAFVTLTIYDGSGQVVRTLDVGHRIAAFYESRSKAIHWDGRNEFGEGVASGVYFYHLFADDFSATRKMLILK